jgi:hypothetical protein
VTIVLRRRIQEARSESRDVLRAQVAEAGTQLVLGDAYETRGHSGCKGARMLKLIGAYALAKLLGYGIGGAIVIYLLLSLVS